MSETKRFFIAVVILFMLLILNPALSPLSGGSPVSASNQSEEIFFTILHTNDEHSALIPHSPAADFHPDLPNPTVGGFARLSTAVKEIRENKDAEGEPVLLLSAGDYIGGSPYSWLIPRGLAPELALMQEIGYDAVIIGNHEFDYGPDNLARYYQAAGYPEAHEGTVVLASNTVAPADHPLSGDLYRRTHVMKLDNGLSVGLFGLIGEDAVSVTSDPYPITFLEQTDAARDAVAELQSQGADVIIAVTHAGVDEDRALAREVSGIDVIVGGHCHTALYEPLLENGVIIAQGGSLLAYLGQLELAYNPDTGSVRLRNEQLSNPYLLPVDYRYAPDPEIDALLEQFTQELNALISQQTGGRFSDVMGAVAVSSFQLPNTPRLQESPFGNFTADAMRIITSQRTGKKVDIAIQANGSIRGGITPGTLEHSSGQIVFYDLAELVGLGIGPDGNAGYPIVSVYLTGEEVRRVLEVAALLREMLGDTYFLQFSGLRYDYNPGNAVLFNMPVLNQPIPSAVLPGSWGAVTRAELYTGNGFQGMGDEGFVSIERGDEELYHLVTDSYILSFLPMVGEMLPMLNIELKDSDGNIVPEEHLDDLIVRVDGEELKVWQTVLEYAASQPVNADGIPEIDSYYAATAGRINPVGAFPLVALPAIVLLLPAIAAFLAVRGILRRRAAKLSTIRSNLR
ncbi:bifunctional metallophosphatase/5'-nucleotidase [Dethiobacter alkaliphilus]|uniref:Metallophosphoesterase n=1 Tax=Dethiobacter alkaliphilus AHT 1 TaxID=555088 RepID=C0GCB8_DETAL|nr:bifunctional UDP-sugar hydrolase/5'-nucleotidase [Dethiobacter alkaliphilus]EEG78853.1 metallophosphoesterase [Dethiobacter alkaliphilus AHT 1]